MLSQSQLLKYDIPPVKRKKVLKCDPTTGFCEKFEEFFLKETPICCSCGENSIRRTINLCATKLNDRYITYPSTLRVKRNHVTVVSHFQLCQHDGGTCNKCPYIICSHSTYLVACGICCPPWQKHSCSVHIGKCMKQVIEYFYTS